MGPRGEGLDPKERLREGGGPETSDREGTTAPKGHCAGESGGASHVHGGGHPEVPGSKCRGAGGAGGVNGGAIGRGPREAGEEHGGRTVSM